MGGLFLLITFFIIPCWSLKRDSKYVTPIDIREHDLQHTTPGYPPVYNSYEREYTSPKYPILSPHLQYTSPSYPQYDYGMFDYDQADDQCPYNRYRVLYTELSSIAKTFLHPDYDLLYNGLFMRLDSGRTEVRYKDIKANLEVSPITIFSNLSMTREMTREEIRYMCKDVPERNCPSTNPKLGELITDRIVETYSYMTRNARMHLPPHALNQVERFVLDQTKWTAPWLEKELLRGLLKVAETKGDMTAEELSWYREGNNVDNILKIIGALGNEIIRSKFDLKSLNYYNQYYILGNLELGLNRSFTEENINAAIDCWYETDGLYHIEEGAEENLLLLQAMIEVVPKDTLKDVFRSWKNAVHVGYRVELEEIVQVIHEKAQEFDMVRVLNLFKVRVENVVREMYEDKMRLRNLFQRVEKLSQMMDKALWRIRAGLWPEMINLLDRLMLSLTTEDGNGELVLWKHLDYILSSTYHQIKTEYQAALIKELFPTSSIKLGAGKGEFWGYKYVAKYLRDIKGRVNPALYNIFVNPQYKFLSEVESYARKINAVEWERWIEEQLYEFVSYFIKTSVGPTDLFRIRHCSLADCPYRLQDKGFTARLFMQDWEHIPKDLKEFLEIDWETYFIYFIHQIITVSSGIS